MSVKITSSKTSCISILGCGWFGFALAKKLLSKGFIVKGSTTTESKLSTLQEAGILPFHLQFNADDSATASGFFETDLLFICIPPKRNSAELQDYPAKIKNILSQAAGLVKEVVFISSTSVYGDSNEKVNESSPAIPDTESGKVILAAEQLVHSTDGIRSTIVRFAGLIGPGRDPGKFFAGKTNIPNGLAPVNLIDQRDAIGICLSILEHRAFGHLYNACSPAHPNKKDFYSKAAKESGLKKPEFIEEMISWKLIESLSIPKYLRYQFK